MKEANLRSVCPICGGSNQCESNHACWCSRETFPDGLFSHVPVELRGQACICQACLERFKRSGSPLADEPSEKECRQPGDNGREEE